jgi:hypothetical protein
MTEPNPGRAATITGRILTGIGTAIILFWAGLLLTAYAGDYSDRHTMTAQLAYLNGSPRDQPRDCLITPTTGAPRAIAVPAMPSRGLDINGIRIHAWFDGTATITCDQPVHLTQGAVVRLYPLIEQWLVLLIGLAIACGGLYRLGLFRHVSRYP